MNEPTVDQSYRPPVPLAERMRGLRRRLGRRIAELRRARGLKQGELATLLVVPRGRLAKWEAGYNAPPPEDLVALSESLGVSVDELLTGNKPVSPQQNLNPEEQLAGHLAAMLDLLK
jgi:transcriptional regulator with XRE-family HTH domain